MIFVTVGSVFPFDRLVRAADDWAFRAGETPLAQIGRSEYRTRALRTVKSLENADYRNAVAECRVVVAHAGMGSILTAGEYEKPIVIMPRRLAQGEHNTDHQLDTARWVANIPGVHVAADDTELAARIDAALADPSPALIRAEADPALLDRLKARLGAYIGLAQ